MLINFETLKKEWKIQATGVLHIGANTGQEAKAYYANGIERTVWIEPIPLIFGQLQENISKFPNALAFNELISNTDGFPEQLNISSNNGESSSILALGTHKVKHPDVHYIDKIALTTRRLDTLFKNNNLNIEDYQFLNIDIQGAELLALKGMGDLLERVKYAYIEVNKDSLYEGCPLKPEIDDFMDKKGFFNVTVSWSGDNGWGDAFYIRKDLLNENQLLTMQAEGRMHRQGQIPITEIEIIEVPPARKNDYKFSQMAKQYRLNIRGIINIGAFQGDQMPEYMQMGIKNIVLAEPSPDAFVKMKNAYGIHAMCLDTAFGEFDGFKNMNLAKGDAGFSNSFLTPKIQKKQYPKVNYDNSILNVKMGTLDRLGLDIGKFNMLHLDANGYELKALMGAITLLLNIDYVCTRVFFSEVFEGNSKMEDVDVFLRQYNFERVNYTKEGSTWGTALYMKKSDPNFPNKKEIVKSEYNNIGQADIANEFLESNTVENEFVVNVPVEFRPHINILKPVDNVIPFEEYFYKEFSFDDQLKERIYLPVFWNSYYINNDVVNKPGYLDELQEFLNTLDKEKEYYTICMYPDGILNDVSMLDLEIFGVNIKQSSIILPMVCQPHSFDFSDIDKDIFISYIGSSLHPVRKEIFEMFAGKLSKKIYISDEEHSLEDYCKILARSRYVICPAGYNEVNFRIAEALQYGAVPINYNSKAKILDTKSVVFMNEFSSAYLDAFKDNICEEINEMEEKSAGFVFDFKNLVVDTLKSVSTELYLENFTFLQIKKGLVLSQIKYLN